MFPDHFEVQAISQIQTPRELLHDALSSSNLAMICENSKNKTELNKNVELEILLAKCKKISLAEKMEKTKIKINNYLTDKKYLGHNNDFNNDLIQKDLLSYSLRQESSSKNLESPITNINLLSATTSLSTNANSLKSSEFVSPMPIISFSPIDKIKESNKDKLKSILEELLESEESYISSLTLLLNYYIEPSIVRNKSEICQPLKLVQTYLITLVKKHTNLLAQLRFTSSTKLNIQDICLEVTKLIGSTAVDVHLYEQYCNIYEDVLIFVKESEEKGDNNVAMSKIWLKGWANYLEATQPVFRHMDLSFVSLIQKPISRIGKYRLIIESFIKCVDESFLEAFQTELSKVKYNLSRINGTVKEFKIVDLYYNINELLDFSLLKCGTTLSSEFFGKPLLIGSLFGIWVELDSYKYCTLGCFLYKNYILLCECGKNKPFEIKFVMPLSRCKICVSPKLESGIVSNYPYLIKLIFQYNYNLYEILLVSLNKVEHSVWLDCLSIVLSFVSGLHKVDFESPEVEEDQLLLFPDLMKAYDSKYVYIDYEIDSSCYFKKKLPVDIVFNFNNMKFGEEQRTDDTSNEYFKQIGHSNNIEQNVLICIKEEERIAAENNLSSVWSNELPFLYYEKRKSTLKKSSSWSIIRMGSLRSLRKSKSFNETGRARDSERLYKRRSFTAVQSNCSKMEQSLSIPSTNENEAPVEKTCIQEDLKRAGSFSLKLKNAVLGLFQGYRANTYELTSNYQ